MTAEEEVLGMTAEEEVLGTIAEGDGLGMTAPEGAPFEISARARSMVNPPINSSCGAAPLCCKNAAGA